MRRSSLFGPCVVFLFLSFVFQRSLLAKESSFRTEKLLCIVFGDLGVGQKYWVPEKPYW